MMGDPVCVWELGAELGEGPVWHEGAVWFVDIKGPKLHRFDPATCDKRSWVAPAPIGFALPTIHGDFVVGLKNGLHRFDPVTGGFTLMAVVEPAEIDNRLNDAAVDSDGYLWFGSLHDPETERSGALYRLETDGTLRRFDEGYVVTNGPAFSPDGRTLYHTDTLEQIIYAFDRSATGAVSGKRVFVRIDEPGAYPDGMVVDADGCIWTGLFGGWGLRRYSPTGALLATIAMPCSRVTKAAFGQPDLKTLFITTARKGLSPTEYAAEPLAGALFAVTLDVPGLPPTLIRHGLSSHIGSGLLSSTSLN